MEKGYWVMDYISRDYVLKCMEDSYKNAGISAEAKAKMTRWLNKAPAADVRPVVRGKWIDMGDFISCSSCNATHLKEFESDYGKAMRLDARTNFCPNCGADMREES
jgi:hypothetical protein